MPHVDIKCFPRELTDEQKTALAADITEVLIRHLNSKESAVSVALTQIEPDAWQAVWDRLFIATLGCWGVTEPSIRILAFVMLFFIFFVSSTR